nr:MAG TPA: replisome organizer [Caudoviricetes sp.]
MSKRRMFSLDIVDTDKFLELPPTTQALYFHLGMRCDDDGFVGSPKKIAKIAGAGEVDLNLLCQSGYLIPFENGVVVITHFQMQNTLKNDRYKPTIYQDEKKLLGENQSKKYILISECHNS